MLIPPRLNKLLRLLLESDASLTVNQLSEQVGASRRTVFRELEHIDGLLDARGLRLVTRSGSGLHLEGSGADRAAFLSELSRDAAQGPADRQERQFRLLLELLRTPEVQKIHIYAAQLEVSEATVGNDLMGAEKWLREYGLSLVRRPGLGIQTEGAEADFRRALIHLLGHLTQDGSLERLARQGLLDDQVLGEVCAILRGLQDPQLAQMTGDSQTSLAVYLTVVVERIRQGRTLARERAEGLPAPSRLALRLSEALSERFDVTLPPAELAWLSLQLSGARLRGIPPDRQSPASQFELQRLTFRMIDRFDPALSYQLKLDEDLVKGLVFHLRSAVVRVRHGMELQDPQLRNLSAAYPEVFEKTRRAAQVLREEYGMEVSESEISFLTMHFGAAVMRLTERTAHRPKAQLGVLCVSGIGTSYMMASQIKARYPERVEVEVCVPEDQGPDSGFDLYLSSVPCQREDLCVLEVHPILDEGDWAKLAAALDGLNAAPCVRRSRAAGPGDGFADRLRELEGLARSLLALLDRFQIAEVDQGSTFEELVKLAGYRLAATPGDGAAIREALSARERIATQVIPEYSFLLLHAKTPAVEEPVLCLLRPQSGPFSDPYLQGTALAVVLLAPPGGPSELNTLLGAVSSALVEDPQFLNALRTGSAQEIRPRLESVLRAAAREGLARLAGAL